jgi:hypothetical protein
VVVRLFRRRRPPGNLRPKLARSERVLAWARAAEDPQGGVGGTDGPGAVVVTTLGLWLPGRARLGWHQIHKATWAGSRLTVVPATQVGDPVELADGGGVRVTTYVVMADDAPVTAYLPDPGDVPFAVRQRVTRSVAYTAHHPLDTGGVRVVARRVPGVDGLAWHVRYDEGTPAQDPSVVARTAQLITDSASPTRSE